MSILNFGSGEKHLLGQGKKDYTELKKLILLTAGAAAQKIVMKLEQERKC